MKLTSADKKRRERNNREQQRSCKISKQIDQLKELLHSSGFKVTITNNCIWLKTFITAELLSIRLMSLILSSPLPKCSKMKKNSKSSVLAGVAEYVKELQVIIATLLKELETWLSLSCWNLINLYWNWTTDPVAGSEQRYTASNESERRMLNR